MYRNIIINGGMNVAKHIIIIVSQIDNLCSKDTGSSYFFDSLLCCLAE